MNTNTTNDDFFENLKKDWQKEKIPQKLDNSKEIIEQAIHLKKKGYRKSSWNAFFYFGCIIFIWAISFYSLEKNQISFLGLGLLSISLLLPAVYQIWFVYKWSEINFAELRETTLKTTLKKLNNFKKSNFYIKILTMILSVSCLIFGLHLYFDSFLTSHKIHKLISLVIILILVDAIFFRYKKVKQENQKFTDLIQQLENL